MPDSANPSSKVTPAPQPVDLELHVAARVADGRTILDYTLNSPSGVADFAFQRSSSDPIVGDPESYHARLIRRLEKLSAGLDVGDAELTTSEVESKLEGFGHDLYRELFPEAMRAAYRRFRKTVRTFLIISEEPWIPWELVKPYDDSDPNHIIDDDFLCQQFQLTRWLAGKRKPAVTISIGKLACLEASSAPQTPRLPHAVKERRVFANIATRRHPDVEDASPQQATFASLKKVIRQGGLGLLHIAAHGDFDAAEANAAEVVLADGKTFRADDLHGPLATKIAQDRPLVFLNACRTAGQNWSLTSLGGWAKRWVALCGCGAFIGPQWAVDDEPAAEFVKIFYNQLDKSDSTFAVAAQAARRRLREQFPGNPAWLAFAVYAHPNGRVKWCGQDAEGRGADGPTLKADPTSTADQKPPEATVSPPPAPAIPSAVQSEEAKAKSSEETKVECKEDQKMTCAPANNSMRSLTAPEIPGTTPPSPLETVRYSRIRYREPVTRFFQSIYHAAPSPSAGLVIIFLLVAMFSGIFNILYRAYVSPKTKTRLEEVRKLSRKSTFKEDGKFKVKEGAVARIWLNEEERHLIIPKEAENTFLTLYAIFGSGSPAGGPTSPTTAEPHAGTIRANRTREQLLQNIIEASLLEYAQRGSGLIDTLLLYQYFDPGMHIDNTFLGPLVVVLLFQLIVVALRKLETLQNPDTSVLRKPREFGEYGARIYETILSAKHIPFAAILIAIVSGVVHYYTYGKQQGGGIAAAWGLRSMSLGYMIVFFTTVLTIVLACLDVEQFIKRKAQEYAWRIQRLLGSLALLLIMGGIFLHGPTTWATPSGVEMAYEMFHYNRFQRFFSDYYMAYGLIVMVTLFFVFSMIPVKFTLQPKFKKGKGIFGFEPFIDFAGVSILTVLAVYLMLWVQEKQWGGVNDAREMIYKFSTNFFSVGILTITIALTALIYMILLSKKLTLQRLEEERMKVQQGQSPPSLEIQEQIENAEWFTLQRIIVEIFKRRIMFFAIFFTFLAMGAQFMWRFL